MYFILFIQGLNFTEDWKLVTILIGMNDICDYCKDKVSQQYLIWSDLILLIRIENSLYKWALTLGMTYYTILMVYNDMQI